MSSPVYHPYTTDPTRNPTVIYPSYGVQVIPTLVYFLGLSIISFLSARRTVFEDLGSLKGWFTLSWARLCVILVFLSSWMFLFAAGLIVSGLGLSASTITCQLGIFACIVLYVSTKLLIYAFLIEKVWIVWSPKNTATGTGSRLSSPIYRVCLIVIFPYLGVLVLMIFGRIAELRADGSCIIGLTKISSMSLLSFDLFLTFFLTTLFIWPLRSSKLISPKLRQVAKRTFLASLMALTTSAINIAVLTAMHGKQLGWVCLSSCGTDVTVNAIVLYWVTSGTAVARSNPNYSPGTGYPHGAVCSLGVPASLHTTQSDAPMLTSPCCALSMRRGSVPKSNYSIVSEADPRMPHSGVPDFTKRWRQSIDGRFDGEYDGESTYEEKEKVRGQDEERRLGIIHGPSSDDDVLFTSDIVKRRSMASLAEERRKAATRMAQEALKQTTDGTIQPQSNDQKEKEWADNKSLTTDFSSVEPPSSSGSEDHRPSPPSSPPQNFGLQPPKPAQLRNILPMAVPIRPPISAPSAPATSTTFAINVSPPAGPSHERMSPDHHLARRSVPHLFSSSTDPSSPFYRSRPPVPSSLSPASPSAYRHSFAPRADPDLAKKMKESRKLSYDFASSSAPISQTTSLPGRLTGSVLPLQSTNSYGSTGGHSGPLPDEHYEFPPRPPK